MRCTKSREREASLPVHRLRLIVFFWLWRWLLPSHHHLSHRQSRKIQYTLRYIHISFINFLIKKMTTAVPAAPVVPRATVLPTRGMARVKNVLSGDTVILLGKATTPKSKPPEVVFTLGSITSPRCVGQFSCSYSDFLYS